MTKLVGDTMEPDGTHAQGRTAVGRWWIAASRSSIPVTLPYRE